MFTAIVLVCSQTYCFAIGGPAFRTQEECIADFMEKGAPSVQTRYVGYRIVGVECYEWKKKVES